MRLEDLTVALRPRLPWEAADLGCTLVRRDFGRILGLWAATVLPIWIILAFALKGHPLIFSGIVWWLKPLYDRVPLHFISRATFGARPGFRDTWKEWPRLWSRFFFPTLLWRRLSPSRSFVLPVWLLEGQRGKSLRSRVNGLAREGGSAGASLTWVFVKLELATFFGLLALASFVAPESGLPEMTDLFNADASSTLTITDAYYWWTNLWYLVTITIVEPFYVGAGFGLYLNCRTKLEGWDIELAFRRTASRITQAAASTTALLLLLLLPISSLTAQSDSPTPPAPSTESSPPEDPNDLAQSVLKEPDFKIHSKTDRVWISDKDTENAVATGMVGLILTGIGYLLLIILIIFLVIVLARAASRLRPPALAARAKTTTPPRFVLGMEITPESLPADLIAAARSAWQNGDYKEALSLLYRGALASLITQHHVPIASSDTEADCLDRVVAPATAALAPYFRHLTQIWTRAAYAGQPPAASEFESLCTTWPFTRIAPKRSTPSTALLLLPLLFLSACDGHWEDVTRETGFKGPARIDPFLAASRFLEHRGHYPDRKPTLADLPEPTSGLIFTSAENGMPTGRALPLLQWVTNGGHLVYTLAGAGPYNDWSLFSALSSYGYFGNDERPDPILEALHVTAKDRRTPEEIDKALGDILKPDKKKSKDDKPKDDSKKDIEKPEDVSLTTTQLRWRKRDIAVELPDYVTFQTERKLRNGDFIAGKPDAAHILSLRHGNGRVTLITHAHPLRSRYLADHDHGLLLDTLAGAGPLDVLFVVGLEGSFWELLWQRAWRPLIALAFAIALWLWMSLPRFGPVRTIALHTTKRFSDHLTTLGSFFLSIRRQDHLIAAAQSALNQRLRDTHPHLTNPADQHTLLASRSNLSLDRVQFALADPQSLPSSQIIRILQDLQTLRLSLS